MVAATGFVLAFRTLQNIILESFITIHPSSFFFCPYRIWPLALHLVVHKPPPLSVRLSFGLFFIAHPSGCTVVILVSSF